MNAASAGGSVPHPIDPPTLNTMLQLEVHRVPVLALLAALMCVLYLAGAIRLWRTGARWSVLRTLSFVGGSALLTVTTGTEIDAYGTVLFSAFMFQQLTLMIAVPPLLVWGSPGRLLLEATPKRGWGRRLRGVVSGSLRSRWARLVVHPGVTIPLFLVAYYGLYFTGIVDAALSLSGGHTALEALFLVAGVLFHIPVLSDGPLGGRHGHAGRLLDVFVELALHAFFGVIVMMSSRVLIDAFATPPQSWGIDPLADQGLAGGLAWGYGEGPTLLILLVILHRWFRDDTRLAVAVDARIDRDGDPELDAYNDYLAHLNTPTRRDPAEWNREQL